MQSINSALVASNAQTRSPLPIVDHIHELHGELRIFLFLADIEVLEEMEPTLKLPKVAHRQPIIVGLNAIVGSKLYIVPVDEGTTVWVTWQVEWL
ncbi:unnamed protein product [Clonostachys rosea f. rosea IK726]|uniref:Uncharacterized protein n=1 Tax=Clonostachys rosea f. rosea IK726 TaxID=1349383 RepID=A0ACA9U5E3_BIOOC|nr:unnamed protein product [Clonostachys rosea f. rosea IK726]